LLTRAHFQRWASEHAFHHEASPLLTPICGYVVQGVVEGDVATEVHRVLKRVALPAEMARRPAGQYSGGSKRKLALGIALVGGVDAVLLDEPSSGMVGAASRQLCAALCMAFAVQHHYVLGCFVLWHHCLCMPWHTKGALGVAGPWCPTGNVELHH
jgi:Fe-S cluster assembly ATPase SufC